VDVRSSSPSPASTLLNRNVVVDGRRTSVRLEAKMWGALDEICRLEKMAVREFCSAVNLFRHESTLTAGIRVAILDYFRDGRLPDGRQANGRRNAA
jgi:predicted DNA-binding ribbon-helix-helix protein